MKKQTRLLISIIVIVIVVLSVAQVAVSNSLSTTGITLSELDQEISQYKKENVLLREKFLIKSSLTNISSTSASLGFSEGKSQIVIGSSIPIAAKP